MGRCGHNGPKLEAPNFDKCSIFCIAKKKSEGPEPTSDFKDVENPIKSFFLTKSGVIDILGISGSQRIVNDCRDALNCAILWVR